MTSLPLRRTRVPLRWQLTLTFLPLILLPVLITLSVAHGTTEQGLKLLVTQRAQNRTADFAKRVGAYYEENGSWGGVSQLLTIPPWIPFVWKMRDFPELGSRDFASGTPPDVRLTRPEQIIIADLNGLIIASEGGETLTIGQAVASSVLEQGTPILVSGRRVGTLVIGEALGILNEQQEQIIGRLNLTLIASGALAAALAIGVGLYLSWQITRPAHQLMIGVRRLTARQWSEPLKVTSQNEFGDLTHAFNHMASEITRQEQIRRQMVADVAHDLRTPLTAMLLEIDAIEAGMQSAETAAFSLRQEAEWLQHLVEDLRLLSLMDADQIHLQATPTPLTPFLTQLHDFFTAMVEEHDRHLLLELQPGLPSVSLDSARMRQVLGNLIDNALRHTHLGGTIILRACADPKMTSISVIDDGEGIAEADQAYVFHRFYRADRSREHQHAGNPGNHGGSGLGLSIAQRLVELHGGAITVSSTPGMGATFTIQLPMGI